ncbi:pentapeptide repeat-containing protein [Amycolatopsis sp. lyj-23]|uniref:pentapeptide repeat-containing protein n=1 Tax=Amycolatopsis sp. lyj-23 TaxID=2789283 RepID=UPI00397C2B07
MADYDRSDEDRKAPVRVLSRRTIAVYAWLLLILAGVSSWLLLTHFGDGSEASKTRLDSIRAVGTIVLGAGGAVGLLLAARRQRTTEQDLVEKRRDLALKQRAQVHAERVQRHAEQVAADTQQLQLKVAWDTAVDAAARRVTELFDTAVDKLGSEKAPVRFGGLYALERLAGHAPDQQPAISKVLCAYLRMPYLEPGDIPGPDTDDAVLARYERRREEREVRLAVQRVLADHLNPRINTSNPLPRYWPNAAIDLTGATLIDLDWSHCRVPGENVSFRNATFTGSTKFSSTTFTGDAQFSGATFTGSASFDNATFTSEGRFSNAVFTSDARFNRTTLTSARFDLATFAGGAWFDSANFTRFAYFGRTTFDQTACFTKVTFPQDAPINENQLNDSASRNRQDAVPTNQKSTFISARFSEATFTGSASFDEHATVDLFGAQATLAVPGAVLGLRHEWPRGWAVRPQATKSATSKDSGWGILVREHLATSD